MKPLVLLLGIVVLLVGVWVMVPSDGDGVLSSQESENPAVPEGAASPLRGGSEAEPRVPPVGEETIERSEVSSEVGTPPQRAETFTVQVVRKNTGEPLPGTTVSYLNAAEIEAMVQELANNVEEMRRIAEDEEEMLSRFGKELTADSRGRVYVPVGEFVLIVGRQADLYGQLSLSDNRRQPVLEEGYKLELERDWALRIRVGDSAGEPVVDVPIAVVRRYEDRTERMRESLRTTAPDGIAEMPHVPAWMRPPAGRPAPIGLLVMPFVPGLDEGGVLVDPESPPDEPIEFRLPETGRVVVHTTDGNGRPMVSQGASLSIAREQSASNPGNRSDPSWRGEAVDGARFVFERVVLGKTYLAGARLGRENVTATFRGPRSPGQEVSVTLSMQTDAYMLIGRALDAENSPLANTNFRIHYRYNQLPVQEDFRSDRDGFFRIPIRKQVGAAALTQITIQDGARRAVEPSVGPFTFTSEEIRLVDGDNNLGDVVLQKSPVIGSGRILVDGEPPGIMSEISSSVSYLGDGSEPDKGWWWTPDLRFQRESAEFRVVGVPRPGRYRIFTNREGTLLPVEALEFELGADNLEIALHRGGALSATALLDEDVSERDLQVRLVPLDAQVPDSYSERGEAGPYGDPLVAYSTGQKEDQPEYRWAAVWPGRYRLEISLPGVAEPVAQVPDVMIVAGRQNQDPRLDGIDLRGSSRAIRVSVFGIQKPTGLGRAPLVAIHDRTERATLTAFEVRDGVATVLTTQSSLDLLVLHQGYRPVELNGVTSDITVTLERVPEIVVRVPGVRELPPGFSLNVSLSKRQARDNRRVQHTNGTSRLDDWLRPRDIQWIRDGEGEEVRLRAGADGPHNLRVQVMAPETRGQATVQGADPAVIVVQSGAAEQSVEVRLPEEGLRAAIERAKRGR